MRNAYSCTRAAMRARNIQADTFTGAQEISASPVQPTTAMQHENSAPRPTHTTTTRAARPPMPPPSSLQIVDRTIRPPASERANERVSE
eukprot:5319036-Prymnesium_polylepis.1